MTSFANDAPQRGRIAELEATCNDLEAQLTGYATALASTNALNERLVTLLNYPSDAMIDAGWEEIERRKLFGMQLYASDIFNAMARALLADMGKEDEG